MQRQMVKQMRERERERQTDKTPTHDETLRPRVTK